MENNILYYPLKVVLIFLIITEALVWLGPIDYHISNTVLLIFYLAIVNYALYLGYKKGIKRGRCTQFAAGKSLINIILIMGLILTVFHTTSVWFSKGLTISLDNILYTLSNSGDVYQVEGLSRESSFLLTLLSPIRWASIPIGIFTWKNNSKFFKGITVTTIFMEALVSFALGTRKGLFDIIIICFFLYLANNNQILQDSLKRAKYRVYLTCSIFLFLLFFIASNISRGGNSLIDIYNLVSSKDIRPIYYEYLPSWLVYSLSSIDSYVSQGYYALSLGLDIGIKPIAPLGTNWFTIIWASEHLGYDPTPLTYMADLEAYGIGMGLNWHTIYLWLANQYTFIGVPFVIYVIGYFFALTWKDTIEGKNIFAVPVFSLFLIMVFYFYANNQVLAFSFIPFIFWLVVYFFTKRNICGTI